jgi:hypothetical protein
MTIEPRRKAEGSDLALTAIVAGYIPWGCALIYRSSFVVDGVRYFCLLDNEMISMRHARNLAHGFGLVYNPCGDRVEGITNPLWLLYAKVSEVHRCGDCEYAKKNRAVAAGNTWRWR